MSDLESRLAKLEAVEAIRRLKARYFNACDEKDADTVEACFLPDATVDAGPAIGKFDNAADFVAIFREMGCKPNIIDMHHGTNAEIEVISATEAEGLWALYFFTIDTEARAMRQLAGIYRDRYQKTDQGWKIAESLFVPHSVVDHAVAQDGAVTITPMPGAIG